MPAAQLSRSDIRPPAARARPRAPVRGAAAVAKAGGASSAAMPGIFDEAWPDGLSPSAAPPRLPWWAWVLVGAWCDACARARLRCGCRALRAVLGRQQLWRSVLLRRRHAAALAAAPPHVLSCELEACVCFCGSWEASLVIELGGAPSATVTAAAAAAAAPPPFPPPQPQGDSGAWRQLRLPCSVLPPELAQVEVHEAAGLSAAAFRRLFCPRGGAGAPLLLRGAPCLVGPCGGSVAWSAAWSVAGLLAGFGPREFTVVDQSGGSGGPACCSMRLVDFAAYVHAQQAARLEQADVGDEASGGRAAGGAGRGAAEADSEPLSLFEHSLPPELLREVRVPPYLDDDLLSAAAATREAAAAEHAEAASSSGGVETEEAEAAEEAQAVEEARAPDLLQERKWLLLGPAGAGSRWHIDPHATSAFNVLFEGRKLWCLAPPAPAEGGTAPADADWLPPDVLTSGCLVLAPPALWWFRRHLAPGAAAAARRLVWAEQRPGEVMCVPHGWWHATLNLEVCLAYTQNVVLPHGARAAIAALDALGDPAQAAVAQALRKVTSERHS